MKTPRVSRLIWGSLLFAGGAASAATPSPAPAPVPTGPPPLSAVSDSVHTGNSNRPECSAVDQGQRLSTNLANPPNYFIKPFPTDEWAAYISGGNHLLNQNDASMEVLMPGIYDPVPTPDGKFITTPKPAMEFYSTKKLLSGATSGTTTDKRDQAPELSDQHFATGVYQSIGILDGRSNASQTTYRIITESSFSDVGSNLYFREYKATLDSNGDPTSVAGDPPEGEAKALCPGQKLKLPMLSKTGQELAAFDPKDGVTKIFKVADDGTCTEELNLGIPTGKVDFSFDSKKIVFHVDSYDSPDTNNDGKWFSTLDSRLTKNVYAVTLNRDGGKVKPDKMTRLTSHTGKGSGSYYPAFRKDGRVVFVNVKSVDPNSDRKTYSLDMVDPDQSVFSTYLFGESYCTAPTKYNAVFALGSLWSQVCSLYQGDMDPTDNALYTLSLDPKACKKLVKKYWANLKDDIVADERLPKTRGIRKEVLSQLKDTDLYAACPQSIGQPGGVRVVGPTTVADRNAQQLIEGKCRDCHASGGPSNSFIDFTHPESMTLDIIDESIKRLTTTNPQSRMPRDELMTDSERNLTIDYLKRRKEQLEQDIANGQ